MNAFLSKNIDLHDAVILVVMRCDLQGGFKHPIWDALEEGALSAEHYSEGAWKPFEVPAIRPRVWVPSAFGASFPAEDVLTEFQLRFKRADIDRLWPPVVNPDQVRWGRSASFDWEGAIIDLATRVYLGEIDPAAGRGAQATMMRAMSDWFAASGQTPSETELKRHAKKLLDALLFPKVENQ